MKLIPLPAFADNYIWLLHDAHQALVVDPGLAALQQRGLQLEAILVTHHHADHTGGVEALRQATGAKVFGPAHEPMPAPLTRMVGGDQLQALARPTAATRCLRERHINPFLRTRQGAVMQAAQAFDASITDGVSTFAALRRWKNEFQ